MSAPLLSVIIPCLDEAANLPDLLAAIKAQEDIGLEVIVADGGSRDNSCEIALANGAKLVQTQCGRGLQMNAAAASATGEYFLFLHADSRIRDCLLLCNAVRFLEEKISDAGGSAVAGHFALRFIRTTHRNPIAYRFAEKKTALNRPNTTNGDQGFLIRRDYFKRLGGFNEDLPYLEDQQLAEKIRENGTWHTLPGILYTSARRFEEEGLYRRYILSSIIMGLFCTGVKEFFRRAPEAYRSGRRNGKIMLTPFFAIIRRMLIEDLGFRGSIKAWYRVGRYVRRNSWQLFFFLDICLTTLSDGGRYPFTRFHDRIFLPLTDFKICDILTAILCFIWFMGILPPLFLVLEFRTLKRGRE